MGCQIRLAHSHAGTRLPASQVPYRGKRVKLERPGQVMLVVKPEVQ